MKRTLRRIALLHTELMRVNTAGGTMRRNIWYFITDRKLRTSEIGGTAWIVSLAKVGPIDRPKWRELYLAKFAGQSNGAPHEK